MLSTKNIFLLLILLFYSTILFSQESKTSPEPENSKSSETTEQLRKKAEDFYSKGQINVIGDNKESLKKIPGSATVVSKKFLEETQPVDAMEILRRVPGASIRFQDAAGLTPNIGFRGVSNEESRKTLILEDGILTSLSPYGQPESYYAPQIDRMQRVEVIKGSGSILFGPSTIGGIVNFVTRKPPLKPTFSNKSIGGENGYMSNFAQYGGTFGKTGVDVSYLYKQGDGFRNYQGFHLNDVSIKLVHEISEKHTITFKTGFQEQDAQSTYLGLTQGLFWKNPKINPAQFDRKYLNRNSTVIGHEFTITDQMKLITRIYNNNAVRNWQREDFAYNNINTNGVAASPPSDTFMTYSPGLIGVRPGDVIYMRNSAPLRNQNFATLGIESKLEIQLKTGSIKHEIDFGVRAHGEKNRVSTEAVPLPFLKDGFPYSQQDRIAKTYAVYLHDRIALTERFKIMPGVRYEWIEQGVYNKRRYATTQDVRNRIATNVGDILFVNQGGESFTKVLIPGFGMTYDITQTYTWFAGVHKGFSPPTYGTAVSPTGADYRLKAESSTNYETGLRGDITPYLYTEFAVYILYFQNQIINTNEISGDAGSRPVNSGKSIHRGSENTITFDFGKFFNLSWNIPLDLIYTYTNAKSLTYTPFPYTTNADGTINLLLNQPAYYFDEKFHLVNRDTNRNFLPYVPLNVYTIALGANHKNGFYIRGEYQYIGRQFSDLANSPNESADGTRGIIPAVGLVNASLGYKHPVRKWSIFVTGKNLQDREYVSGRLPIGIQPGPFRQINFGISFEL
ncbi:MAG TPA: TonB-dependent receptor [Leptospiraceae bacterium]|nr:TonB-dependent receptor [Leptospiraceae bacterium]HMX35215.1 TonB-dependent receptor [Leptospiraceae bacterium]HMY30514.1 TonB-dependent receptor [Leptospiraceae bacterium]HMZ66282.1 TonB-dependent receptor [Leptospiraceae bacterium]HNA06521.1 TonB-dependent receptor [Leptospiraceae bacterium]